MICKVIRRFWKVALASTVFVSIGFRTFAQDRTAYRSDVDDLLTIERVSVLPFTDNLEGIYARPLEADFIAQIGKMHRWDYVASTNTGPLLSPQDLEAAPDKVQQIAKGLNAQGLFAVRIIKGPSGVDIRMDLFLTKDGKLLLQAELKDYQGFDVKDLEKQTHKMLVEILARIPYSGRVLSRDGNRVTVNLGTLDGLQAGTTISAVQIIKATRHPKFNFLINTDKEILGTIKITQADDTLSFGQITTEKERGAIQKNAKIGPLDFVSYPVAGPQAAIGESPDSQVAFGKNPTAWKPERPPEFGQVGARLGLSRFDENMNLTGVSTSDATDNIAPSLILDGELWVTPQWTFHARIQQGLVPVSNPRSGASPSTLNQSLTYYEALLGYRIRFGRDADAPYAEPFFGYLDYKLFTDTNENTGNQMFTTTEYSGLKIGVKGETPIGWARYGVGGEFSMVLNPSLHESPFTSGDSSNNTVVQFGFYGFKKWTAHLRIVAQLDFDMYSTTFSGAGTRQEPATSASQRYTTLSGGLYYMF